MKHLLIAIATITIVHLQWNHTSGAKILMAYPGTNFYAGSHVQFTAVLSRELVKRGHHVVAFSNSILKNRGYSEENYSEMITFNLPLDDEEEFIDRHEILSDLMNQENVTFSQIYEFAHRTVFYCQHLWRDNDTLERLRKENFDLMLINPFGQCEILLHCYLDVPFIVFTPGSRYPTFNEDIFRVPSPASYVPGMLTGFTDEMTFLERTMNIFVRTIGTSFICHFMVNQFAALKDELGFCPDGMSLLDINRKAELWLCNTDIAVDFAQPYTPNKVPVGGLTAQAAKPLPRELEEFVQGANESGLVVVSMGSSILLSDEDASMYLSALSRLPQRSIFRHKGKVSQVYSNVRSLPWIPQDDLIGHNKTRLFIGHGGINGIYEAIYHAVPMIIIPRYLDQHDNAARMCKKGIAVCLHQVNEDILLEAITQVLSDKSYQEAATQYSAIHKDQPLSPRERAVFWIEHVINHGGAHLRPHGLDMNFVQYYMLDVAIFILGLAAILIGLFFLLFRGCYRCFCRVKLKKE